MISSPPLGHQVVALRAGNAGMQAFFEGQRHPAQGNARHHHGQTLSGNIGCALSEPTMQPQMPAQSLCRPDLAINPPSSAGQFFPGAGVVIGTLVAWACLNPTLLDLMADKRSGERLQPPVVLPLAGPAAGLTIDNSVHLSGAAEPTDSPAARTQEAARRQTMFADSQTSGLHATTKAAAGEDTHAQILLEGFRWAQALAPQSHLIQYGSSRSIDAALKLGQRYPDLAQARLVAFRRKGESSIRFALVSGPYASRAKAADRLAYMDRNAPTTSWIRRSGHLQAHLVPPDQQEPSP